jgi:hypothetical protein
MQVPQQRPGGVAVLEPGGGDPTPVVCTEYLTGEHFAGMPEDAGHYSPVTERLPAVGTPPDRTTQTLADMLKETSESRHALLPRGGRAVPQGPQVGAFLGKGA